MLTKQIDLILNDCTSDVHFYIGLILLDIIKIKNHSTGLEGIRFSEIEYTKKTSDLDFDTIFLIKFICQMMEMEVIENSKQR